MRESFCILLYLLNYAEGRTVLQSRTLEAVDPSGEHASPESPRPKTIDRTKPLPVESLKTYNQPCAKFDDERTKASMQGFRSRDSLSAECVSDGAASLLQGAHTFISLGYKGVPNVPCFEMEAFKNPSAASPEHWEAYADSGCLAVDHVTRGSRKFFMCFEGRLAGFVGQKWKALRDEFPAPFRDSLSNRDIMKVVLRRSDEILKKDLRLNKRAVEFAQSEADLFRSSSSSSSSVVETISDRMKKWVDGLAERLPGGFNQMTDERWEKIKSRLKEITECKFVLEGYGNDQVADQEKAAHEKHCRDAIIFAFEKEVSGLIKDNLQTCLADDWEAFTGLRCRAVVFPTVGYRGVVIEDVKVTYDDAKPCLCSPHQANPFESQEKALQCSVSERLYYHPAVIRWGIGMTQFFFQTRHIDFTGVVNYEVAVRVSAESVCRNPQRVGICWTFTFCTKWETTKAQLAKLWADGLGLSSGIEVTRLTVKLRWMDDWLTNALIPWNTTKQVIGTVARSAYEFIFPKEIYKRNWWEQDI
uniref:Uncharacterized protein n=1 Tax=Chromera velia CCMP2878 TaxID=1169474 RepID=A0A0G4HLU1_9ALVE|eukprot:Cvel_7417.t1-p1 / transcript=Cvel_7417.t1 / gene=Cvel_7417 / organism=Chromera_velia_CCMP2878 / gene_product=hypothetical protein / transcript_product=hypothetical protein / location=Cvel_scaffold387:60952-63385(-) / protein_length=529 / sequence_SO=supercontig / SO=protein_coding / is_pseudo=false